MHNLHRTVRASVLLSALAFAGHTFADTVSVAPLPAGTVIDSSSTPFSYTGSLQVLAPDGGFTSYDYAGSVDQQVIRQSDGTLAFTYHIAITSNTPATPVDGQLGLQLPFFTIIDPNANDGEQLFVAAGSTVLTPTAGDIVSHKTEASNFQVLPGNGDLTTGTFFVTTTATTYDENATGDIEFVTNGLNHTTFAAFESASSLAPVPEPMSLALLPLAVGALGLRLRRR